MSLSFWIRNYVFMPLAMLRPEQWCWECSLLIAMVTFGVWHKGTLPYLLFGCSPSRASPAGYLDHFLPSSLYLLVATLAIGYALTLLVAHALDRYSSGKALARSEVLAVLVQDRWLWIVPIYAFATLAVLVLIHHLPQNGPGPFMYAGY